MLPSPVPLQHDGCSLADLVALQVTNEITPVLSYSYMVVLVPIFLLTDYLRYKPVLMLQSLSYISIWLILIFGTSILAMQFMELFYSITMAARVAYSSYIFSLVTPSLYQRMASYSRSAVLMGVFTSSVLGQLCVTVGGVPFITLNYISLGFTVFGLFITLFLERPRRSLFFNRAEPVCNGTSPSELDKMHPDNYKHTTCLPSRWRDAALCRMLRELRTIVRQPQLRLWSFWWIFNSAGYYLMLYYVQILWEVVYPAKDNRKVYNGGVDAASTLLGTYTSWLPGFSVVLLLLQATAGCLHLSYLKCSPSAEELSLEGPVGRALGSASPSGQSCPGL